MIYKDDIMEDRKEVTQKDKEQAARKIFFEQFCNQYQSLMTLVHKLPVDKDMKSKSAVFMDSGFLWVKEAFIAADVADMMDKNKESNERNENE